MLPQSYAKPESTDVQCAFRADAKFVKLLKI